jgi:tetratricopeptide (TPR) repeat protein
LLDAMHLEVPPGLDGVSLFHKPVAAERGVYFETLSGWARFGWSPIAGWCDAHGKYIHCSAPQFFDLRADPAETHNLFGAPGVDVARYRNAIAAVIAAPPIQTAQQRAAGATVARGIADIGYGDPGEFMPDYPDPLAPNDWPAPRNQLAEYAEFEAAQALAQNKQFDAAVAKLEPLVAKNPRNIHALDELASDLVELGQWQRAIDVLEQRMKHPPDRLSIHQLLVRCYTELHDQAKAREHSLRALELLIEASDRRGEHDMAERYRAMLRDEVGRDGK